jgi:hypothetical protein
MQGRTGGRADGKDGTVSPLDDWVAAVSAALGLDNSALHVPEVLDLARDVAHGVTRPAAPITAFLVGLAAGRAGGDATAVRASTDTVLALLRERSSPPASPG